MALYVISIAMTGLAWAQQTITITGDETYTTRQPAITVSTTYQLDPGVTLTGSGATTGAGGIFSVSAPLYFVGDSTTSLLFTDNRVTPVNTDGGVFYVGASGGILSFDVGAVTFSDNRATRNGGAIYADDSLVISGGPSLIFQSNTASNGTTSGNGGAVYSKGDLTIIGRSTELSVRDNYAATNGGGFYVAGSATISGDFTNIQFSNNRANAASPSRGAAIYAATGDVVIDAHVIGTFSLTDNVGGAASTSQGAIAAERNLIISGTYGAIFMDSNTAATGSALRASVAGTGNSSSIYIRPDLIEGAFTVSNNMAQLSGNRGAIMAQGGIFIGTETSYIGQMTFLKNSSVGNGSHGAAMTTSNSGTDIVILGGYGGILVDSNTGSQGGAFWAQRDILIDVFSGSLSFQDNSSAATTTGGGGALYAATGSIAISGSYGSLTIKGNTAIQSGGALYTANSATGAISVTGSYGVGGILISSNNSGVSGGALYASRNILVDVSSAGRMEIANNQSGTATGHHGGALFANGGSIMIDGSYAGLFVKSNTAGGSGGAFNAASTTLGEIEIAGSYAGGGIQVSSNTAGVSGGAFYAARGILFDVSSIGGMEIASNRSGTAATNHGGALFANSGSIVIGGSSGHLLVQSNIAGGSGGAFYAANNTTGVVRISGSYGAGGILIDSNTAGVSGGAFYANRGILLDVSSVGDVEITNNQSNTTTSSHGGAFYAGAGGITISGSYADFIVRDNYAKGIGGAFYTAAGVVSAPSGISITGSYANITISSNTTMGGGGGAFSAMGVYAPITISTTTSGTLAITKNYASGGNGGGAFFSNQVTSPISILGSYGNILISSNTTVLLTTGLSSGGAISSGGDFLLDTLTAGTLAITSNTSNYYGGAIHVSTGSLVISGSYGAIDISKNNAGSTGTSVGGAFSTQSNTGDIKISATAANGMMITSNTAGGNGGAFGTGASSNGRSITIEGDYGNGGIRVERNTSISGNGGAFFANSSININADASRIFVTSNTASGNGGAFHANTGSIAITGSYGSDGIFISSNTGGGMGGALNASTGVMISATTAGTLEISENFAKSNGGALHATSGSIAIGGNYGAILISSNSNTNGGGGAFYALRDILINANASDSMAIIANSGSGNGGALHANSGSITISGSYGQGGIIISSNTSTAGTVGGGALYGSTGIFISSTARGTLDISENIARASGGALYTGGSISITGSYGDMLIAANSGSIGGAFFATRDIRVNAMSSGTLSISRNYTTSGPGGAFYSDANIAIGGTYGGLVISSNSSAASGGALNAISGSVTVGGTYGSILITSNTSLSNTGTTNNGGAINAGSAIVLSATTANALEISKNFARGVGGAFTANTGSIALTGKYGSILISSNTAGTDGGAFQAPGNIRIDTTTTGLLEIKDNASTGGVGGALYSSANIDVAGNYGGIVISSNSTGVGKNGGAFTAGTNLTISTTAGSLQVTDNSGGGFGGALNAGGTLAISGSYGYINIQDNETTGSGGALRGANGISINATTGGSMNMSGNSAGGSGGALQSTGGTISITGSYGSLSMQSNSAAASGGAIYSDKGVMIGGSIASISIKDNTVTGSGIAGGAIYSGSTFTLRLANDSILEATGNKVISSATSGGFLYTASGSMLFDLGAGAVATIGDSASVGAGADGIAAANSVTLNKQGAGTLVLWGDNTYKANTNLIAGKTLVNGALASGTTSVKTSAILGGSGTIGAGTVTIVEAGGTITGGDIGGYGKLTVGNLRFSALGARGYFDLSTPYVWSTTENTWIHATGTISAANGTVLAIAGNNLTGGLYHLMSYGDRALASYTALQGVNWTLDLTAAAGIDASKVYVQTEKQGEVNLVYLSGLNVNYWDGPALTLGGTIGGSLNDGIIQGGNGTWQGFGVTGSWGNSNWTISTGSLNAAWQPYGYAMFGYAAPVQDYSTVSQGGTVTVDGTSYGQVGMSGASFGIDGYVITGGTIFIGGTDNAIINVANAHGTGAAVSATIASVLTGTGPGVSITKTGTGTLVLTGSNTYSGSTVIHEGTLIANAAGNASYALSNGPVVYDSTTGGSKLQYLASAMMTQRQVVIPGASGTLQAASGTNLVVTVGSGSAVVIGAGGTFNSAGSVTYTGNVAPANGGAIWMDNGAVLNLSGGTTAFSNNSAVLGGAIYGVNRVTISGSVDTLSIQSNRSNGVGGGAIYGVGGIRLSGTYGNILISSNTASGRGGAFYVDGGDIMIDTLTTGTLAILNNYSTANNGGALSAQTGDITLTGTYGSLLFQDNNAKVSGGVFQTNVGDVILNAASAGNLEMRGNVGRNGGVANAVGDFILGGTYANILIVSNSANESAGGAINVGRNIIFSATSSGSLVMRDNYAAGIDGGLHGGVGRASGGSVIVGGTYGSVIITSNTAARAMGGAFYASQGIILSATTGNYEVTNNKAQTLGGAFYASTGFELDLIDNAMFTATGNRAANLASGGFLYASSGNALFNLGNSATATIGVQGSIVGNDSISGGTKLVKSGQGTLVLNVENSYTGGSEIRAGDIVMTNTRALSSSGAVDIGSSGTLNVRTGQITFVNTLTGQGLMDVSLLAQSNTFSMGAASTSFSGTARFRQSTYTLTGGDFAEATVISGTGSKLIVDSGSNPTGDFVFDGGTVQFDLAGTDSRAAGWVDTGTLTLGVGKVQIDKSLMGGGSIMTLPLLQQEDSIIGRQLIRANGGVDGDASQITLVDLDGTPIVMTSVTTAIEQTNLITGLPGSVDNTGTVATGYYSTTLATTGTQGDGLYLGSVLTQLQLLTGKTTVLTSDSTPPPLGSEFHALISGSGHLWVAASGTITLNYNNTYTGTTTVSQGTLLSGTDNALGRTAQVHAITGGIADLAATGQTVNGRDSYALWAEGGTISNTIGGILTISTTGAQAHALYSSTNGSLLDLHGADITTSGTNAKGAMITNGGVLSLTDSQIHTTGSMGYGVHVTNTASATLTNVSITTDGYNANGLWAVNSSTIAVTGGTITTNAGLAASYEGGNYMAAVYLTNTSAGTLDNLTLEAHGDQNRGLYIYNSSTVAGNNLDITVTGTDLNSIGVFMSSTASATLNDMHVSTVGGGGFILRTSATLFGSNLTVETLNDSARGMVIFEEAYYGGTNLVVDTKGTSAYGLYVYSSGSAVINGGTITTQGLGSYGIIVSTTSSLSGTNFAVTTSGSGAYGIYANTLGDLTITGGTVTTTGERGHGLAAANTATFSADGVTVRTSGSIAYGVAANTSATITGSHLDVRTTGDTSHGIYANGGGSVTIASSTINVGASTAAGILASNSGTVTINDSGFTTTAELIRLSGSGVNYVTLDNVVSTNGANLLLASGTNTATADLRHSTLSGNLTLSEESAATLLLTTSTLTGASSHAATSTLDVTLTDATSRWNLTGSSNLSSLSNRGLVDLVTANTTGTALRMSIDHQLAQNTNGHLKLALTGTNAPVITASSAILSGTLEVTGFGGFGSNPTKASQVNNNVQTVIATSGTGKITGDFTNVLGLDPTTGVDYIVNTHGVDTTRQYYQVYSTLAWYSGTTLGHGTFTLTAPTDSFNVDLALTNQDSLGSFASTWDGRSLTKLGAGTLTLSASNSYTGTTNLLAGLVLGGTTNTIASSTQVVIANGATFQTGTYAQTLQHLSGSGTALIDANGGALTLSNTTADTTFAGAINGSGPVTKTGAYTLTLTGTSTLTDHLIADTGTLAIVNPGQLTSTTGTINANATVNLAGTTAARGTWETAAVAGTGTLAFDGGLLRAAADSTALIATTLSTTIATNGAYLDTQDYDVVTANRFTGVGALHKLGTGTLALSGSSDYSGGTQVEAGTLVMTHTAALGATTGTVAIATNAELRVNTGDLRFANPLDGTGLLTVDLLAATNTIAFTSHPASFRGTAHFADSTLVLDNDTFALATVQLAAGNRTLVSGSNHAAIAVGNLTLQGGRMDFDVTLPADLAPQAYVTTGTLDLTAGGTVAIKVPTAGAMPDPNTQLPLLQQDEGRSIRLIASTTVNGSVANMFLTGTDGSSLTDTAQSTSINQSGTLVATGTYDYVLRTNVSGTSGLYVNYELAAVDILANRTLLLASDTTAPTGGDDFHAKISGSGNLQIAATSTITLQASSQGANTYTGTTSVTTGALVTADSHVLGNTAQLDIHALALTDLHGTEQTIGSLANAGTLDLASGTLVITGSNGHSDSTGTLTGAGLLVIQSNTLSIQNANTTLTASTTIAQHAAVDLAHSQALGTGTITTDGDLYLTAATGTLVNAIAGTGTTTARDGADIILTGDNDLFTGQWLISATSALTAEAATALGHGSVDLATTGTLTLGGTSDWTLHTTNTLTGSGILAKDDVNTVTISHANTAFTGTTLVNSGTLVLTDLAATGTANAVVNDSALALSAAGTFSNDISGSGTTYVTSATVALTGSNATDWQITPTGAAVISGSANLGTGSTHVDGTLAIVTPTLTDWTYQNTLTGTGLLNLDLGDTAALFTFDAANSGTTFAGTVLLTRATYDLELDSDNMNALAHATLHTSTGAIVNLGTNGASSTMRIHGIAFDGGLVNVRMSGPDAAHYLEVTDLYVDRAHSADTQFNLDTQTIITGTTVSGNFLDQDNPDDGILVVKTTNLDLDGRQMGLLLSGSAPLETSHIVADGFGHADVVATYGYVAISATNNSLNQGPGVYVDYLLKQLESNSGLVLDNSTARDHTLSARITGTGFVEYRANTDVIILASASNTYTGTSIITSGTVVAAANHVLGETAHLVTTSTSAFSLRGHEQTLGALTNAGLVNLGTNGALTISGTTGSSTSTGVLSGSGTLVVQSNTLTIQGNNGGLSALTQIDAPATVVITHVGGLGTGAITDHGTLNLALTSSGTLANALSGSGALIKSGSNTTATINRANNDFSGTAAVQAGVLTLAHLDALASAPIEVSGSATAQYLNLSGTIRNVLSGSGTFLASGGVLTIDKANTIANSRLDRTDLTLAHATGLGGANANVVIDNSTLRLATSVTLGHVSVVNAPRIIFNSTSGTGPFKTATLSSLAGTGAVLGYNLNFTDAAGLVTGGVKADYLNILGSSGTGTHTVVLAQVNGTPAQNDLAIELVRTTDGTSTYLLDGGSFEYGAYAYDLLKGGSKTITGDPNSWYLAASGLSHGADAVITTAGLVGIDWNYELDSLHQRMGDVRQEVTTLRERNASDDNYKHSGNVWVRSNGYRLNGSNSITGMAFDQYAYGITGGADKAFLQANAVSYLGAFVGMGHVDRNFENHGEGDSGFVNAGLYATWLHQDGWYADFVYKASRYKHDLEARADDGTPASGRYHNKAQGLSLELGRQLKRADGWWVEPFVQASVGWIGGASYDMGARTGDETFHVEVDNSTSSQLRGMVRFGRQIRGSKWYPYGKFGATKVFSSGGEVALGGQSLFPDFEGWRVEFGAGTSYRINDYSQLYLDYEYNKASHYERPWAVNLGYRRLW